jgi:hypothetical protein
VHFVREEEKIHLISSLNFLPARCVEAKEKLRLKVQQLGVLIVRVLVFILMVVGSPVLCAMVREW